MLITILNYYVIIAQSFTVLDIAKDFIALMVISEFDNFFYEEHSNDQVAKKIILEKDDTFVKLFNVQTTSSSVAYTLENDRSFNKFIPYDSSEWVDKIQEEIGGFRSVKPRFIKISNRSCRNATLYWCIYKPLRFLYVGFWFYFSPFFMISIQFILPLYVLQRDGVLPSAPAEDAECPA